MTSSADVEANLAEARRLIAEAATEGARLVVLPENFALMAGSRDALLGCGEADGEGPIQDAMADAAKSHGVWLVAGTIPLRSGREKVWAASIVYDEDGHRVARYDKIHLFDASLTGGENHSESRSIEAGTELVVVDTPAGRLGLSVCYDLRFPELYRGLLAAGAQIISIPSAFTAFTGRAHWESLVRARAIENLVYVIAAAQVGQHAKGRETYGHSMIVDPWGEVLTQLPQGSGVVRAECDLSRLAQLRMQLPSTEHRRL